VSVARLARRMKTASIETETNPDDIDEKSPWVKFCTKRGINSNLVMLKVTLFVMYGGESSSPSYQSRHFSREVRRGDKKSLISVTVGRHEPSSQCLFLDCAWRDTNLLMQNVLSFQRHHHSCLISPFTCRASASPWRKSQSSISPCRSRLSLRLH
jgi:hypothetical protein